MFATPQCRPNDVIPICVYIHWYSLFFIWIGPPESPCQHVRRIGISLHSWRQYFLIFFFNYHPPGTCPVRLPNSPRTIGSRRLCRWAEISVLCCMCRCTVPPAPCLKSLSTSVRWAFRLRKTHNRYTVIDCRQITVRIGRPESRVPVSTFPQPDATTFAGFVDGSEFRQTGRMYAENVTSFSNLNSAMSL